MATETETRALIDRLAAAPEPVRPIAPPMHRAALWLALSLPITGALVLAMTPRADLALKLAESRFVLEQAGALVTAIAAAAAAFAMVVPGLSRRWAAFGLAPAAAWVLTLGAGCVSDLARSGREGLALGADAMCLPYIAMIGMAPAALLVAMLRRGAPTAPRGALFLAMLAAAAMGNFGLRFFHEQDAGLMVLVWQFGSVLLLASLGGLCGPHVLCWRHRSA